MDLHIIHMFRHFSSDFLIRLTFVRPFMNQVLNKSNKIKQIFSIMLSFVIHMRKSNSRKIFCISRYLIYANCTPIEPPIYYVKTTAQLLVSYASFVDRDKTSIYHNIKLLCNLSITAFIIPYICCSTVFI